MNSKVKMVGAESVVSHPIQTCIVMKTFIISEVKRKKEKTHFVSVFTRLSIHLQYCLSPYLSV